MLADPQRLTTPHMQLRRHSYDYDLERMLRLGFFRMVSPVLKVGAGCVGGHRVKGMNGSGI